MQTNQGCLRVAIALVHLDTVHEGLVVGRNIASDAIQVRAVAPLANQFSSVWVAFREQRNRNKVGSLSQEQREVTQHRDVVLKTFLYSLVVFEGPSVALNGL